MNTKKIFTRVLPATFLAGALFGVAVGTIGAAFKGSAVFRDVPSGHYADDAIGEMYQLGIIKGLDSAHFGPDDPITRGQVAILLQRLRNEIKGGSTSVSSSSRSFSVSSTSSSSSSSVSSVASSSSSSVSSVSNGAVGVRFASAMYTVAKNDATGLLTIAIVRIGGNTGPGTIDYSFSGGTAVAGKDYQPLAGTLTFSGPTTSAKLQMTIMNNASSTGNKTVQLVLRRPTGSLKLADPATAIVNITDPFSTSSSTSSTASSTSSVSTATTISLGANAYGVAENGGTMTVTVNRTGVTTTAVGVNYGTTDGSAHSGSDYTAASGTFNFAAGETSKTFTVAVNNDNLAQGNRTFNIVLSSPTGGAGLNIASAPATINDDENIVMGSGSLKFSSATYAVSMSQGKAVITVNHVLGVSPVTVHYATVGGSATSGNDYTPVNGTLSFGVNEVSKTFTVPLVTTSSSSGGKTVNISLDSPSGGVPLSDPLNTILTINQ